ncbi:MAG TPA: response regulator [Rhizomicrobium sp.]|jgi:CheY-like chemotaxis protein
MSNYRFDKLRLLVVDDSQHMRKLVGAILRGFGVRDITEAPNAEYAWAKMIDCNPDVVITDWFLEGMSGIDFARKVRSSESANPLVPLIMLTGYTHITRVREARDAGFNEFLAKPVTPKALMTRLCSVIDKPRPFVRTERYFGPCRRRRPGEGYEGPKRRTDEVAAQAQLG